jgi:hypothetical protein
VSSFLYMISSLILLYYCVLFLKKEKNTQYYQS